MGGSRAVSSTQANAASTAVCATARIRLSSANWLKTRVRVSRSSVWSRWEKVHRGRPRGEQHVRDRADHYCDEQHAGSPTGRGRLRRTRTAAINALTAAVMPRVAYQGTTSMGGKHEPPQGLCAVTVATQCILWDWQQHHHGSDPPCAGDSTAEERRTIMGLFGNRDARRVKAVLDRPGATWAFEQWAKTEVMHPTGASPRPATSRCCRGHWPQTCPRDTSAATALRPAHDRAHRAEVHGSTRDFPCSARFPTHTRRSRLGQHIDTRA
jgi:hypothetical protein